MRLYMDCLAAAAINAARAASMPSGLPPPPPPTPTKTCLYRGPLLLTYDPRFNGLERQDTAAAPFPHPAKNVTQEVETTTKSKRLQEPSQSAHLYVVTHSSPASHRQRLRLQ